MAWGERAILRGTGFQETGGRHAGRRKAVLRLRAVVRAMPAMQSYADNSHSIGEDIGVVRKPLLGCTTCSWTPRSRC